MSKEPLNPNEQAGPPPPPSTRKLLRATALSVLAAALLLVLVVLPAEYGLDPTGFGRLTGLSEISAPGRTLEISNVVGGNELLREVQIPDYGEPVPLPNPAVFQDESEPARTETLHITIPAERETEVKLRLQEGKVIVYSWAVDQGDVYVDYHGHDPALGDDFWVRYKEQQEGSGNHGSLTAPFSGEHGWYWLNYNDYPVVITLRVTGYYEELIDYGIF